MERAYARLTIKSIEEDQRVITGIATTPKTDRMDDIVEPEGAVFELPLPFLWQHNSREPVGHVTKAKVTKDGIEVRVELVKFDEPGDLKNLLDKAWGMIKTGLVRGLSIGFSPIESADIEGSWGRRFLKWSWLELSGVTIPANEDATIQTIKSYDTGAPAATGTAAPVTTSPRARGPVKAISPTPGVQTMNVADQIKQFEATRQAKAAQRDGLMTKAAEAGTTLDASQEEEHDTLGGEITSIDKHLVRLREMEQDQVRQAKRVEVKDHQSGAESRSPTIIVRTPKALPPGVRFARMVKCRAVSKLEGINVREVAAEMYPDDELIAKTNVPAGATLSGNWAATLVGADTSAFADFAEFLRPQTILGQFGNGGVPGLMAVPFRVPLLGQTEGGTGYWVGEGKSKPLTKFAFSRTTLEPLKVANIAVLTEEVVRSSAPSADTIVRDGLVNALRERLDIDFIDPAKAVSAGISPASITNGVAAITSSGNTSAAIDEDVKALMAGFIAANNPPKSGVWIMSATTALALSLMKNPLGQAQFPGISMDGGTFAGRRVIVSEYVPTDSDGSIVILVNASDIYLGDEGRFAVDVSREASLEMDDAPSHNSTTPTESTLVSLWQTNSVGFRAEREINWKKRRDSAVQVLDAVNWGAA